MNMANAQPRLQLNPKKMPSELSSHETIHGINCELHVTQLFSLVTSSNQEALRDCVTVQTITSMAHYRIELFRKITRKYYTKYHPLQVREIHGKS